MSGSEITPHNLFSAQWPAPDHIKAVLTQCTTAIDGLQSSTGERDAPFGFNLSFKTGDDVGKVSKRRSLLESTLPGIERIYWLEQIHGSRVVCLEDLNNEQVQEVEADASFTFDKGKACVVSTADCLPILLTDNTGSFVAAVHAGWKGLYQGIIRETVVSVSDHARREGLFLGGFMAFIGPAISQAQYQVDRSFRQRFLDLEPAYQTFFEEDGEMHFRADLKGIAKAQLMQLGVSIIRDCDICTYEDSRFYSHRWSSERHDPGGRFASLIWMSSL